jgi:hypothetical protein
MEPVWVTDATYAGEYKISLTFSDGFKKIVDLKNYKFEGIFEPLKNPENFRDFHLSDWTIEWDNGADIAPETLYVM